MDDKKPPTMRDVFPENLISYLPKGNTKLAYVGHAALTHRLLDVDPNWNWEPIAFDSHGLPALDENGGLWIRLTVCGVTRLGYGDAGGKSGCNAMKERIGDALRNAGMRFGAALDLWHKGDLHADETPPIDYLAAIKFAPDIETLKSHFAAAWKMADKADQGSLKHAYDTRTQQLTPKAAA